MNTPNYAVAIDIGNSKVCGVVGTFHDNGIDISIEAFTEQSFSINNTATHSGKIINLEQTARLIDTVLAELAIQIKEPIEQFMVSISGSEIEGNVFKTSITRSETYSTVQDEDITNLITDVRRSFKVHPGHILLHTLPQSFDVDNRLVVGDPVGNVGVRLGGSFYAVTAPADQVRHLYECIDMIPAKLPDGQDNNKLRVSIENVLFSPIPDSIALLSARDKDGVCIVNIGSETTEISVFIREGIRYTNVIPVAGKTITQDIADAYNLSLEDADVLKLTCSALPIEQIGKNDVMVLELGDGIPDFEIPTMGVYEIIESRLREIAAIVTSELIKHDFLNKLNKGIILSGGGANVKIAKDIFAEITDLHTRIGNPLRNVKSNSFSLLANPKYSTVIGLMLSAYIDFDSRVPRTVLDPNLDELFKNRKTTGPIAQKSSSKKSNEGSSNGNIKDLIERMKRIVNPPSKDLY